MTASGYRRRQRRKGYPRQARPVARYLTNDRDLTHRLHVGDIVVGPNHWDRTPPRLAQPIDYRGRAG